MTRVPTHAILTGARVTGSVFAASALLIACGSSGKSAPAGASGANASVSAATTSAAAKAPAKSGAAAIETHKGPLGTFLTDSSGKTLYMFASDKPTKSTCSSACAVFWPPLITKGTATATGGALASKITTLTRSDGSKQVVYAGHPLYYFKEDSAAGDTKGQGSDGFGAKWWVLKTSGAPIT